MMSGFVINEASVDIEEYDLLQRDYPTSVITATRRIFICNNK